LQHPFSKPNSITVRVSEDDFKKCGKQEFAWEGKLINNEFIT